MRKLGGLLPVCVAYSLTAAAGTFTVDYRSGQGEPGVMVGDANHDGKPDLAVSNDHPYHGTVSVLPGNGDDTFRAPPACPMGTYAAGVTLGDVSWGVIPAASLET